VLGPDGTSGDPVHAKYSLRMPKTGEEIFVVHHAQCFEKLVSKDCQVKKDSFQGWTAKSDKTDFTHDCNTESGASGAPVFDQNGEVIGLHHVGASSDDGACRVSEGENKAIKLSEIMKDIKCRYHPLAIELGMVPEPVENCEASQSSQAKKPLN
jgi:hypothetical protein